MKPLYLLGFVVSCILVSCQDPSCNPPEWDSISVNYDSIPGIGFEEGCSRRDPSDIIKIDDVWYVYYTKVFGKAAGYWGSIWAAKSTDNGYSWSEIGEVLGLGEPGAFDSQATFTPNIIKHKKKFYLYYTGVKPTPGRDDGVFENNSHNDYTAIGVAISDSPEGPFLRENDQAIISVSESTEEFDSYRVDDAVLIEREGQFWLYYKGRNMSHGQTGPRHTRMGVAFSENPDGPFTKYDGNPILSNSHEVLAWAQGSGVACLASISSTIEYAQDGLDFATNQIALELPNRPNAPGLFRPDLSQKVNCGKLPEWGISMIHNGSECYLIRFSFEIN